MLETDADREAIFFNPTEHGTTASVNGVPGIKCLFTDEFEAPAFPGIVLESSSPTLMLNTTATAGLPPNAVVIVTKNGRTYRVKSRQPDGEGMTTLTLVRA